MPNYDLSTLGECMLRISTPPGTPLAAAESASLHAAGSESNVAAALASLGRRTAWASRLPDSPPGRLIANQLRRAGVDLSHVQWTDTGRVGTFFVELEHPPTPVRVTYDRVASVASQMSPEMFDWPALLGTRLLHLTGITPALSPGCLAVTQAAVRRAREADVPLSFDINYRRKLWPAEEAKQTLLPLVRGVELLFIGQADAAEVFGLTGPAENVLHNLADLTAARRVVLSIGEGGVIAWDSGTVLRQPAPPTAVLDRLGAGDALAAGVIHGWLESDFEKGLKSGAALAALCLRRHGDIVLCRPDELEALITGGGTRPQR